jgi:hypothetical protein
MVLNDSVIAEQNNCHNCWRLIYGRKGRSFQRKHRTAVLPVDALTDERRRQDPVIEDERQWEHHSQGESRTG